MTAAYRPVGHRLLQQLRGTPVDRELGLQLRDPRPRCGQLVLLCAGQARQLPGIDEFLPAPGIDHLVADLQIAGEAGDLAPSTQQVYLAAEPGWYRFGTSIPSKG